MTYIFNVIYQIILNKFNFSRSDKYNISFIKNKHIKKLKYHIIFGSDLLKLAFY